MIQDLIPGVSWVNPDLLLLLVFWLGAIFLYVRTSLIRKKFHKLLGLQNSLVPSFEQPLFRSLKTVLFITGTLFLILASLGPQWGEKPQTMRTHGLDICFALDISKSMLAEDVNPNRLGQIKNQLSAFLPQLGGDRGSLVSFAGSAYIAAPLSIDHQSLRGFLDPLEPDFMSFQATNFSQALEQCGEALGLNGINGPEDITLDSAKVIVLLSDGENTLGETPSKTIKQFKNLGIPIFSFAVGTLNGGTIPVRDEEGALKGYLQDPGSGKAAITQRADGALKEMAEKTGGKVYYAEEGSVAWKKFESDLAHLKRSNRDAGSRMSRENRFQWPLILGLILLFIDFLLPETSFALVLMFIFIAPVSTWASMAPSLNPLVVKKNNEAIEALKEDKLPQSHALFTEALSLENQSPWLRYNWASAKMSEKTEEASQEFKTLLREIINSQDLDLLSLKKRIHRQLAHKAEIQKNTAAALAHYYQSLNIEQNDSYLDEEKKLDKETSENIALLLKKQQESSSSSQNNSDSKGEGGGGQGDQKSEPEDNKGEKSPPKNLKDGEDAPQSPPPKAKFSNQNLSESDAREILESVGSEERQVQKKKARSEAQQRRQQDQGKEEEGSFGENNPEKPW